MTKRNVIGIVALLVAGVIGNEYYKRKQLEEQIITAPVLKENEKEKIIIDTNRRTVTTINKGDPKGKNPQVVKVREGVRKVVVIRDDRDNLTVRAINKGFTFEPGLALYYSDKARLGLDIQVAYYKRWGVLLGAGVNMGDEPRTVRGHVAVSHALPLNFLDNTTAFIGVDHRKDLTVGLRIRF